MFRPVSKTHVNTYILRTVVSTGRKSYSSSPLLAINVTTHYHVKDKKVKKKKGLSSNVLRAVAEDESRHLATQRKSFTRLLYFDKSRKKTQTRIVDGVHRLTFRSELYLGREKKT